MKSDKSEIQREHFNKVSERYSKGRSHKSHLAYKKVLWDYVFKEYEKIYSKTLRMTGLEAMAGTCEISLLFLERYPNLKMRGFDYSDNMVEIAKEKTGGRVDVFQCDILKFNEKEKYDFVVLIGGLHHVPDSVLAASKNIFSSLKKGGVFINFEPTHNNFLLQKIREKIYKKNSLFEENSERGFTLKEYNELLTGAGFSIRKQFYPGLLGYVLYYNPDAFPFLNMGGEGIAKLSCKTDICFGNTFAGKYFSFATFTIAQK